MALIDELKQKRAECHERYNRILADEAYYLGRLNDLDRAIAALEPAPTVLDELDEFVTTLEASPLPDEPAPAEPEAEPEPSLFDAEDEDGPPPEPFVFNEPFHIIDEPEADDDAPAEFISDLTGDPAVEPESGLHVWTAEELVQLSAKADAFIAENGLPQVSVLDDPELIEAQKRLTARLEADTLAQVHSYWSDDVRAPPVPLQPEPTGYVGLQDKELEADYDAMRERENADKPKLHFSIFGERGNRKLEEV